MPVDHIRYDILVQEALRGMVRDVLAEAGKNKGCPASIISSSPSTRTAEGVRLSDRLRAQYPEEMTIVLQHQFWDLKVTDDGVRGRPVVRRRGGAAGRAVRGDQGVRRSSVQFTLQFETLAEAPDEDADDAEEAETRQAAEAQAARRRQRQEPAAASVPASPRRRRRVARRAAGRAADKPADKGGAEVVRLDRFRKK